MSKISFTACKVRQFAIGILLSSLCILSGVNSSYAQRRADFQPLNERRYIGIHFDDDFLFLFNSDEQYTGGLEIEFLSKSKNPENLIRLFNPFQATDHNWIFVLGTSLYTPYNLSDSLIILNDRPYSSYIYGSFGYSAYDRKKQRRFTTELSLGIIGSALPGKVQSALHSIGDSKPTNGWQYKIGNKTTFAPNFKLNITRNLIRVDDLKTLKLDQLIFAHFSEVNAGIYQTNLNYGWQLDAFHLRSKTKAPLKIILHSPFENSKGKKLRQIQINPYILTKIQMVVHNTALEGLPWIKSPYTLNHEDIHRLVLQLEAGLKISYKNLYFKYNIVGRSKEYFEYSRNWHIWAGINLGINF
ncbi:lipid A-modifier LpxR family protein [Crocinitomix catalasitica]|uniref:lipid A-modifier LpxR family protein n=1 Tax=Crocinitomix catalasitica TaxID=184607 RepID=UPI000A020252|nr:lipid A-modifier LpxR family protein [Crocinitomix catalasitica]